MTQTTALSSRDSPTQGELLMTAANGNPVSKRCKAQFKQNRIC